MSQDSQGSQASALTLTAPRPEILHFAYGPLLAADSMLRLSPDAVPVGLAYLPGWSFTLNPSGRATIVPVGAAKRRRRSGGSSSLPAVPEHGAVGEDGRMVPAGEDGAGGEKEVTDGVEGVYGMLYLLPEADETALDAFEVAAQKTVLEVEIIPPPGSPSGEGDVPVQVQVVRSVVYLDPGEGLPGNPGREYACAMNGALEEAVEEWGMPEWYVERVLRRYIPPDEYEYEDKDEQMKLPG
ncbi:uncharacterized protein DNG_05421 [Cephalotrichum gorgonifer]|uniref:Uncharacterized protein n=1 Tax=Cephalotrichum gorgonifer TaxID=2041049 RepID=A0AAE8SVG9_9PEZI|nr:uncharacterized protein DNG_05421 [Cephalotrichum gorgonifer]